MIMVHEEPPSNSNSRPPLPVSPSSNSISRTPRPPTSPSPRSLSSSQLVSPRAKALSVVSALTHPLHDAALRGDRDGLQALLVSYPTSALSTTTEGTQYTPLHLACISGDSNCIKQLIRKGVQLNMKDARGRSALHLLSMSIPSIASGTSSVGVASESFLKSARMLIKKGAKVSARDEHRRTPLHNAVIRGNPLLVSLLLQSGAHIKRDGDGFTPYHLAALKRDVECLKVLVYAPSSSLSSVSSATSSSSSSSSKSKSKGTNKSGSTEASGSGRHLDAKDFYGRSPLHLLVSSSSYTTSAAIQSTPSTMSSTPSQFTLLSSLPHPTPATPSPDNSATSTSTSSESAHASISSVSTHTTDKTLFPLTPDNSTSRLAPKKSDEYIDHTPVPSAHHEYDTKAAACIRVLMAAGASLNVCDHNNQTPLHYACQGGYFRCTEALLCLNVVLANSTDSETISDGDLAATVQTIQALNRPNNNGELPIHLAASFTDHNCARKCIKRLLTVRPIAGVDGGGPIDKTREIHIKSTTPYPGFAFNLDAQDNAGSTALHRAIQLQNLKAIALLVKYKVSVTMQDFQGHQPLHYAIMQGNFTICSMLTSAGADVSLMYKYGRSPPDDEGALVQYADVFVRQSLKELVAENGGSMSPTPTRKSKKPKTKSQPSVTDSPSSVRSSPAPKRKDSVKSTSTNSSEQEASESASRLEDDEENEEAPRVQIMDRYGFVPESSTNAVKFMKLRTFYSKLDKQHAKRDQARLMKWVKMLQRWQKYSTGPAENNAVNLNPNPNPNGNPNVNVPNNNNNVAEVDPNRAKKLKRRIVKGIPDSVRGTAWPLLADIKRVRETVGIDYKSLLDGYSPHVKQIDLDINRTDRNHILFSRRYGKGQQSLFNVLKAYSLFDEEVGYCQGMSGIAALLLMYLEEEDAFWTLVALMQDGPKYNLRALFMPTFPKLYQSFEIHEKLVERFLPDLDQHFKEQDVMTSTYATKWFLTLYLGVLPFPVRLRVWDLFISEGFGMIHMIAFAFLKQYRKQLLESDFEQIIKFFCSSEYLTIDPDSFLEFLYSRSVPRKKIRTLIT